MLVFLKTALTITCFVSLVPLSVFAATGSLARAGEALKSYLTAMGLIVALGVLAGMACAIPQAF